MNFKPNAIKSGFLTLTILVSLIIISWVVVSSNHTLYNIINLGDNNQTRNAESDSNLYVLQNIDNSPKLQKYTIYITQPTKIKEDYLIIDYDPLTDEYLYQLITYQNSLYRYFRKQSNEYRGKRSIIEAVCVNEVGKIYKYNPYFKYGLKYIPLG